MAPKPTRSEPKAKGASRAGKPRKSATKPKSPHGAGAKAAPRPAAPRPTGQAAFRFIDERIRSLGGWRAEAVAEVRRLIHEADPDIVEECKWIKPRNPLGLPSPVSSFFLYNGSMSMFGQRGVDRVCRIGKSARRSDNAGGAQVRWSSRRQVNAESAPLVERGSTQRPASRTDVRTSSTHRRRR